MNPTRRHFLSFAGLGLGGIALASLARAGETPAKPQARNAFLREPGVDRSWRDAENYTELFL